MSMTRTEADRYLFTRRFNYDCIEAETRFFIEAVITLNGGIFRRCYFLWGLSYEVTFPTQRSMLDCIERLKELYSEWLEAMVADGGSAELLEYDPDFVQPCGHPVTCFETIQYF